MRNCLKRPFPGVLGPFSPLFLPSGVQVYFFPQVIHSPCSFLSPDESVGLVYLDRLMELHRVLKRTGAIYLHCDPVARPTRGRVNQHRRAQQPDHAHGYIEIYSSMSKSSGCPTKAGSASALKKEVCPEPRRFEAASKYVGSISIPIKRLSNSSAAMPVEPTPMNGSNIRSPGFDANLTKCLITLTGFCVG